MAIINGDDTANILTGGSESDIINGLGGNDTLTGGNGDDTLGGAAGNDVIDGGNGDDAAGGGLGGGGGLGNDVVRGGNGNDGVGGGGGDDIVDGSNGDDFTFGGPGNDIVNGGNGYDQMLGGPGNDIVNGGNGNDDIVGDNIFDPVGAGVVGADILTGGNGADKFFYNAQVQSSLAAGTMDEITDFKHLEDVIVLVGLGVTDTGVVNQDVGAFQADPAAGFFSAGTAVVVQHSGGVARVYVDLGVDGNFDPLADLVIALGTDPGNLTAADFIF